MPEQPQWSERTLDMPPQDPWADPPTVPDRPTAAFTARAKAHPPAAGSAAPTEPHRGGRPVQPQRPGDPDAPTGPRTRPEGVASPATPPTSPYSPPATPPNPPYSAGRASVRPHPRSPQFVAEHEPTGTGWPGAEVPYTRPSMGDLRRGGEWTTAALLWAFVCWGIWALSNDGVWSTKIIIFVVSVIVAGGLFALSRLVGRIVLEKQFHRVRRSARGSHAVASLFLLGVGLAHLQQTDWVMNALGWVIKTVG
jgi:hypothetical protein